MFQSNLLEQSCICNSQMHCSCTWLVLNSNCGKVPISSRVLYTFKWAPRPSFSSRLHCPLDKVTTPTMDTSKLADLIATHVRALFMLIPKSWCRRMLCHNQVLLPYSYTKRNMSGPFPGAVILLAVNKPLFICMVDSNFFWDLYDI